ncbi:hypothetical protein [Microbulbifer halophilus]|uniref:Uncharacterized protein n=1 Tax=Microbulbifer halophilus TaxID=453963 RepID=A0ABW5EE17_9GAMM|nr:hypothetical protein [Microbulbifer halophilus]MCW8128421.1 hypothetical protein [Microbulbifer halophilus]
MKTGYWLRRFALAYLLALAFITGGQLLRGRPPELAFTHGLLWALITAAVYLVGFAWRARRECAAFPEDG